MTVHTGKEIYALMIVGIMTQNFIINVCKNTSECCKKEVKKSEL